MKLSPKHTELASKLKSASVLRGVNMDIHDLRCINALISKGLVKKTADHKSALTMNASWMFKYEPTQLLKDLGI